MASAALDSEAAFAARLKAMSIDADLVKRLAAKGYNTFGGMAFAVASSPNQVTDEAVLKWARDLLASDPTPFQLSCIRRLIFESHTYALADMQLRIEPQADIQGSGRKLPPAEREARQKEQERRLVGVMFAPETVPSHTLVDVCVEMAESGILTYIKPESCTSRAQEMQQIKKDTRLQLEQDGTIKLSKTKADASCNVGTELELRGAYARRSLALDLAGVASYLTMEKWVHNLFVALQRPQPSGFARVALSQIIECDKQMFIRASHALLAKLSRNERGGKPFDAFLEKAMFDPELIQYLQPLQGRSSPLAAAEGSDKRPPKRRRGRSPQRDPGAGHPRRPGASPQQTPTAPKTIQLPPGCVPKMADGKPICFAFNRGQCKYKGPGQRCARGHHVCYKEGCFRKKPFIECTHTD